MRVFVIIISILVILFFAACYAIADYLFRMAISRKGVKTGEEQYDEVQLKQFELVDEATKWFETKEAREVEVTSYDGLRLSAQFLPAKDAVRTVICAHGFRASGMKDFGPLVRFYHENQTNVLLMRQRAHDRSEGDYLCYGVKERYDVQKWLELVNKELVPEQLPVYLHGVSMGCGTVVMASDLELPANVKGVVADCGYTSPWNEFEYILSHNFHLPNFPILYFADAISTLKAGFGMKEVSTLDIMDRERYPMLFIHGDADTFVPTSMGQQNYERCVSKKKLVLVEGAGHALSWTVDFNLYTKSVSEFFKECEQG